MTDLTRVQVFLASPSDVAEERAIFARVIEELNRTVAIPAGLYLDLVRWETHVRPGVAADAQAVVNEQIGPRDLFVGMMWTRFGTPTGRAGSGTEEEFERAYKLWRETGRPRIMLYFKKRPFYPSNTDDVTQFGRVLDFRRNVQERGALVGEFVETSEFGDLTRQHLTLEVQEILRSRARAANAEAPRRADDPRAATDYESQAAVLVRPTLAIVYRSDGWHIQNKGRGAALDILVAQKHVQGPDKGRWFNPVRIPPLAPGEEMHLAWLGHENDTGLGAAYRDESDRPFSSITGNDLTRVVRECVFPPFREDEIRRHWQVQGFYSPVSLNIGYTDRRIESNRHEYRLRVIANNDGETVVRDWAVELRVPRPLLEPRQHYPIVESASDSDTAVMRWTELEHSGPIYPGEQREVIGLDYFVDDALFERADSLFVQVVAVAFFAGDRKLAYAQKAVGELQKF